MTTTVYLYPLTLPPSSKKKKKSPQQQCAFSNMLSIPVLSTTGLVQRERPKLENSSGQKYRVMVKQCNSILSIIDQSKIDSLNLRLKWWCDHQKNEKVAYEIGKINLKSMNPEKGFISKIKNSYKSTLKKKKILKWGKEMIRFFFFQRRHTDSQQAHDSMLNITHHHVNADQNQNEMQLTPAGMSILKRQEIKSAGEDVGEGGPCAVLVGMKLVQSLQKTVQRFLRKLKIEPRLGMYGKAIKTLTPKKCAAPCALQTFLITAKLWNVCTHR